MKSQVAGLSQEPKMEETEMEMEGGLSPASLPAYASLATRPVWDPGLPAWRHEAGAQRPVCGTGSLLAVGLGRDLIRGALLDGAHGSWRASSSFYSACLHPPRL